MHPVDNRTMTLQYNVAKPELTCGLLPRQARPDGIYSTSHIKLRTLKTFGCCSEKLADSHLMDQCAAVPWLGLLEPKQNSIWAKWRQQKEKDKLLSLIDTISTFDETVKNLSAELRTGAVDEVVLSVGEDLDLYCIRLPRLEFTHQDSNHRMDKYALQLLRSISSSSDFQQILSQDCPPLNTSIFVKKNSANVGVDWLSPYDGFPDSWDPANKPSAFGKWAHKPPSLKVLGNYDLVVYNLSYALVGVGVGIYRLSTISSELQPYESGVQRVHRTRAQELKLYNSVIEDVISGVRECFLDEGVDEQVLQELKQIWETKLINSKAVEANPEPPEPQPPQKEGRNNASNKTGGANTKKASALAVAASEPAHMVNQSGGFPLQQQQSQNQQQSQQPQAQQSQLPLHHHHQQQHQQMTASNQLPQQSHQPTILATDPNKQVPIQITLPAQAGSPDSQPRVLTIQVPASALQGNTLHSVLTGPVISATMSLPPQVASSLLQQHEPLNSGDDVSDDDPTDLFDTDNVVVCQYDKITRSRNKWKFYLKDGIMSLGGKDYVFQKANGDAEW
uniref:Transcription initiation factor IIA subunit 1 n=1 Tax=Timema monikensis TaxID=170555 RepID=A0A7R9E3E8_9NEOP|nr:unnamed protein product [Timema monikensis]